MNQAKTFEFVIYEPAAEGEPVTSAVTEYDRAHGGQLTYVGRAWLDEDATAFVLHAIRTRGYPITANHSD